MIADRPWLDKKAGPCVWRARGLEGNKKMAKKDYSEDLLIQAPTAELL